MQRPFVPGLRYSGTAGWIEFVGSAVATIFTLVRDPLAVMNNILIQCHPENIVEVSVAATPCCLLFSAPMIYCVGGKSPSVAFFFKFSQESALVINHLVSYDAPGSRSWVRTRV